MQMETFFFQADSGWSISPLPDLDSDNTLVIAFGAAGKTTGRLAAGNNPLAPALAELSAHFPKATLMGCSTAGEIFDAKLLDGSLTVAALRFDEVTLRQAQARIDNPRESAEAGRRIARKLIGNLRNAPLRAVFILSEGLSVNGSELVRGLNHVLPDNIIITGGLAGDGDRFQHTCVMANGTISNSAIVAVGLYGDTVRVAHGSMGGWDIFGMQRKVTRSVGNTLYELDGQPALQLYKKYLGERATGLPATGLLFPLALLPSGERREAIVRTILSIDEQQQSITFAGDIPTGVMTQLMRANFDRLIDGACDAATHASLGSPTDGPLLSIAISCIGRRLVLGERTEEEIEATLEMLPDSTRQIGFYAYGEISPLASGSCDLHNQTMTLTTIGEAV